MNSVSKNIKKVRLQRKLTQENMAQQLFVTRQTVSNWENGKSQPDIDTLLKIADTLDVEITTLLYGSKNSDQPKRNIKQLVISSIIFLVLSIMLYFFRKIAVHIEKEYFFPELIWLLQLFYLPFFWLVAGWTFMQFLNVIGGIRPINFKYTKIIHILTLTIVLLYAAIMIPYLILLINVSLKYYHYWRNQSLYPNGFSFVYSFPGILGKIYGWILLHLMMRPSIFILPSIIFWLTKPMKKEANTNT